MILRHIRNIFLSEVSWFINNHQDSASGYVILFNLTQWFGENPQKIIYFLSAHQKYRAIKNLKIRVIRVN